jgi:hypothetical protein
LIVLKRLGYKPIIILNHNYTLKMLKFKTVYLNKYEYDMLNKKCTCSIHNPCILCSAEASLSFRIVLEKALDAITHTRKDKTCPFIDQYVSFYELLQIVNTHIGRIYMDGNSKLRQSIFNKLVECENVMCNPDSKIYKYNTTSQYKEILDYIRNSKVLITKEYTERNEFNKKCIGCHCNSKRVARRNTRTTVVPDKYFGKEVYIYNEYTGKYQLYWENYCVKCKMAEMAKYE